MASDFIKPRALRFGLLGGGPVGKTAICYAFIDKDFFNYDIMSNIPDRIEKNIKLKNNENIKIVLWDTTGQERFRSAAFKSVRSAQGIILVFDVTSEKSFYDLITWLEDIKENLDNPFIILFGNKTDLPKENWRVTPEEINKFAQERGLAYFETSAKTKKGIMEGITYMANEIYDKILIKNKDNIIIKEKDVKTKKKSVCVNSKQKK